MTPSHPDPASVGPDNPARNQMGRDVVAAHCFSALAIAGSSAAVKSAVQAFRDSRTPWDATALANSLATWDPGNPNTADLIETLYREADACAGFPLPNKRSAP